MAIFSWLTQKLNGVESVVDSSKVKYSSNMSETSSVYDEISDLKSDSTREGVFTGTTSSAGNISVGKTISEIKIISGYTQSGNYMCIPWLLSGTNWYFRVLKEINGSIVPEANVNVSIHYMYKKI